MNRTIIHVAIAVAVLVALGGAAAVAGAEHGTEAPHVENAPAAETAPHAHNDAAVERSGFDRVASGMIGAGERIANGGPLDRMTGYGADARGGGPGDGHAGQNGQYAGPHGHHAGPHGHHAGQHGHHADERGDRADGVEWDADRRPINATNETRPAGQYGPGSCVYAEG